MRCSAQVMLASRRSRPGRREYGGRLPAILGGYVSATGRSPDSIPYGTSARTASSSAETGRLGQAAGGFDVVIDTAGGAARGGSCGLLRQGGRLVTLSALNVDLEPRVQRAVLQMTRHALLLPRTNGCFPNCGLIGPERSWPNWVAGWPTTRDWSSLIPIPIPIF